MKRIITIKKVFQVALLTSFSLACSVQGETILRFGYEASRSDTQHLAAQKFATLLSEGTDGQLTLKLFPDSVLGNAQSMINGVRGGVIDMEMSGSPNFSGLVAEMNVLDIPFIFRTSAHAWNVLDGEVGEQLLTKLDTQGLKGLAFWEVGFRSLTNSKREIQTPEDVKGLKIRINPNPMYIKAFELLGANPVPMPLSELYTALETHTVDAQEHPIGILWSAKLYEVQKYLSLTHHAYTALIVVMNKKRFDALPQEQQKVLVKAAKEAGQYQRQLNGDQEQAILQQLKEAGVEIVEQLDITPFRAVVEPPVREYFIERHGSELVTAIEQTAG